MREYVKINTMFKRDMADKGRIIEGDWSTPEIAYLARRRTSAEGGETPWHGQPS